ncbi:MAG: pilus assembly protein PilZ [Myxococcaceae bacterium]|nr:pilus assembly protein PilZ [Myxococcaceae bacterium]MCI0669123.1 pilus assembly protein PilZ [Myxococcaceae bacterium]
MAEKRCNRRHPRRFTVRFGEEALTHTGFSADVSPEGIFVASLHLPPLDARVHLEIQTSGGTVCREAVVRRHRVVPPSLRTLSRQGFGARFLTPDELFGLLVPRAASAQEAPLLCRFATAEDLRRAFDGQLRHGGLFLRTERSFERDAEVQLELRLDFVGERLEAPARVVQVTRGVGVGLLFTDVAATRDALARFLPDRGGGSIPPAG